MAGLVDTSALSDEAEAASSIVSTDKMNVCTLTWSFCGNWGEEVVPSHSPDQSLCLKEQAGALPCCPSPSPLKASLGGEGRSIRSNASPGLENILETFPPAPGGGGGCEHWLLCAPWGRCFPPQQSTSECCAQSPMVLLLKCRVGNHPPVGQIHSPAPANPHVRLQVPALQWPAGEDLTAMCPQPHAWGVGSDFKVSGGRGAELPLHCTSRAPFLQPVPA